AGRRDELAPIVAGTGANTRTAQVHRITGGNAAAAEHGGADRAERAGETGAAFRPGHAAANLPGDRVAEGIELRRQAGQLADQCAAEAGEVVVDHRVVAVLRIRHVGE